MKMKNEKQLIKKRLILYLLLTFVLTWTPMFVYLGSGLEYDMQKTPGGLLALVSMLWPALAMLLTRLLTKEGFALTGENSLLLGIRFQNKKWVPYLLAFLLPLLYWLISDILWFLMQPQTFDTGYCAANGYSPSYVAIVPLLGIYNAVTISFGALGEELGWRSYLYPKLEQLFGTNKALLIGGTIWGIWHFPLVANGHVGTGYLGEPYTGMLLFTLDCIGTGVILMYLTKKSGSVWPAVFCHAFNNTCANPFLFFCNMEKAVGFFRDGLASQLVSQAGVLLTAALCYRLMCPKKSKKG